MSELESRLLRFRKRVRLVMAWRGMALGATVGATLSLLLAVLDFFRIVYSSGYFLGGLILVGALFGAIAGGLRKISTQKLADSIDRRARLQNRLGTASESPRSFTEEVHGDALSHLGRVQPKEVYPVRVTRWHGVAGITALLAACLFILGNTPILLSNQERADREELARIAKEVERVAKPLLDRKPEDLSPEAKELAHKYERFSKELEKGRMPREEAMQRANELAKDAEKMAKEQFAKSDENLQKAQDVLSKMAMDQALAESGLTPEELAKLDPAELARGQNMGDEQRQQELDALAQKFAQLQKQLAEGKDANGESLSDAQKDALAADAEALKKQMKALELSKKVQDFLKKLYAQPEFKELMEMMKNLKKVNQDGKQGTLDDPQYTEEQIKEMLKKLDELADKLGRDDKAMKEFLEQMKKALEQAGGG